MEAGSNKNLEIKINEEINSDSDILDNVDNVYFTDDFNSSRYELEVTSFFNFSCNFFINEDFFNFNVSYF